MRDVEIGHLRLALRLAARGRYTAYPNPMVGAVVTDRGGRRIGRGYHHAPGQAHAEVAAFAESGRARGGTLYVTLEPCSHHGRTPPCIDAVVASGVGRVVACHADPDFRVRGRGLRALRDAGIEVAVGPLAREAVRLNLRYLVEKVEARPMVTLKWAQSLDGKIATASGESQWISSPKGRQWALALREEHDAILVGSGTALADDPSLDRRLGLAPGPNVRVVLDRRLRVTSRARLLTVDGPVIIYTESGNERRIAGLRSRGVRVARRKVWTLRSVLRDLHRLGVGSVLVEGGAQVLGGFVAAGEFDRVEVCTAPKLIGGGGAPGPIAGSGVAKLADAPRIEAMRTGRRGPDRVMSGVREGLLDHLLVELGGA
ncbi:MAG: bifunctional diaminohydroxyphosphoribosylaminopyrimidine deaminase/5-amino-6-(5-phosphoribosylamino)uracil reductase RibD [Acidobacteriota bacterium]|nr:bifunctional diaminohydroxyphosphoribosylaminopyrimidine deaminase/5-amino-6-(5-phosphoribosylamino)uracil reductase RibD [Acidobacteriota bacterium]